MATRIAVVGAGIVGVSCASYLLREGYEVELIDRDGPAAGASQGNAGALSPGSCIPLAMPGVLAKTPSWLLDPAGPLVVRPTYLPKALPWLIRFVLSARPAKVRTTADALRALHEQVFASYAPLVDEARCRDLIRRTGTLNLYRSESGFAASRGEWAMRRERGVDVQEVDGDAIRQLEPSLAADLRYGVFLPEHGYVADPKVLVERLAERFVEQGGRLVRGDVSGLDSGRDRPGLHLGSGDTRRYDRIVVAAGAWSARLLATIGVRIPLETQRGYQITLSEPGVAPRLPVTVSDDKVYATPMLGGLRIAGTVEFAGLDGMPDWPRAERLVDIARRIYPGIASDAHSRWLGHRPCLPDSLPAIGPIAGRDGFIAAFGHGHNGMTSGPTTGRIVADLIAGRPALLPLKAYDPARFASASPNRVAMA